MECIRRKGYGAATSPALQDNRYDIIIDDGSHIPGHQLTSLACLLPALNPGGLYVIEGLETSYWCTATDLANCHIFLLCVIFY